MFLSTRRCSIVLIASLFVILMLPSLALGDVDSPPPVTPEITLEQAIELALTNSEAYRNAKVTVNEKAALLDYSADMLGDNTTLYSYRGADLAYTLSKMSRDQAADQARNTVTAYYGAVLVSQAELESALSDQFLAEQEFRIAQAQYNAGTISSLDFEAIKQSFESNDTTVEIARANLNSSYTAFNTMIGMGTGARPILIDETVYEEIKVDNLESEVNRVLVNAPLVYQAEQQAVLKEWEIDTLGWYGAYRPYEARMAELKQAKLNVTSVRETWAATTRNIYYSILSVEENYQALQDASKAARLTAQKQQAYYDAGMCTRYDLEKSLNAAKGFDAQLISLKWNHNNLVNSFATPWAASV